MMIYRLLEATAQAGWVDQAMQFVSEKWAELLGWICIPTVGVALLTYLGKIIIALLTKKIKEKGVKPVIDGFEAIKIEMQEMTLRLKDEFSGREEKLLALIEEKIKEVIKKIDDKKTQTYKQITNADAETQALLKELETNVVEIESLAVKIEEDSNETIEKTEAVIEEGKEIVEEATTETKSDVQIAKRIIEGE